MLVKLPELVKLLDENPLEVIQISGNINWTRIRAKEYLSELDRDGDDRRDEYDIPRVKYFINAFRRREIPDAVRLGGYYSYDKNDKRNLKANRLTVYNGYHRISAAIIVEAPVIEVEPVEYLTDLLKPMKAKLPRGWKRTEEDRWNRYGWAA